MIPEGMAVEEARRDEDLPLAPHPSPDLGVEGLQAVAGEVEFSSH